MDSFRCTHLGGFAVVVALVAGQGCAAVTYQDAKMVGKGNLEFTPTVSHSGVSWEGKSAGATTPGAMLTLGVSDKVDVVAGFQGFGSGIGPKFSLVQDRAALFVPVSIAKVLQLSPTAVFSVPIGGGVTFNPGAKVVWTDCDDCGVLVGAHVGFSLPSAGGRVVLRPEVGMLKSPGDPGLMWAFGVGLSLRRR